MWPSEIVYVLHGEQDRAAERDEQNAAGAGVGEPGAR